MPFSFFTKEPIAAVAEALTKRGFKFHQPDSKTIICSFGGAESILMIVKDEEEKKSLLFLFIPMKGSLHPLAEIVSGRMSLFRIHTNAGYTSDQVAKTCEFLMQQNYEMFLGAFERDASDGEIRLRVALPYRDCSPTRDQAGWCIDTGLMCLVHGIVEINRLTGKPQSDLVI